MSSFVSRPRISPRLLITVGVALALVLLALLPETALASAPRPNWNPGPPWAPLDPKSPEMHMISNLFWIMLVLSGIVFIGVFGALIISIVRFSAGPNAAPGPQIYGNRIVEISWTAIPFLILIGAFIITAKYIHDINTSQAAGPPLNIIARGHQWWWEFYYPSLGVVTANEVHVPAGVPLHFHVESADVIHSFWAPQLQRQIDANPGQDNAVFVTMPETGVYGGACYEYCGDAHAWMKFEVIVQTPHDFALWVKHQKSPPAAPSNSLIALGRTVFMTHTCIKCHTITGVPGASGSVGPNLTHVGSRWAIAAGALPVSVPTVMMWIHDPNAYKPGVLMPGYPLLSQKDLRALATYLVSLK
ncbi:MAG TPA: cytochrome c oxidase subunit II [Chloroflexota bacterium]|nr:cytochrome c oxidase subunit II [Chloroflexota bacterium]